MRPISRVFDSPADLIAAVDAAEKSPSSKFRGGWPQHADDDYRGDRGFLGSESSWEDFKKLAAAGSPKLAAKVEKLRASVDAIIDRIRARSEGIVYDVSGQWLDVGRLMSGEPEAFGSMQQVEWGGGQSKVVRVEVNVVCSGGLSPASFAARGAAAAAFADLVESSGRRVEIYALRAASKGGRLSEPDHQIRVKLKSANEPLDLAKVALAIADPGLYRRAMWAISANDGVPASSCSPVAYRHDLLPPGQSEYADRKDSIMFGHVHLADVEKEGGFERFLQKSLAELGFNVDGLFDKPNS
jgi:hypothetical protein